MATEFTDAQRAALERHVEEFANLADEASPKILLAAAIQFDMRAAAFTRMSRQLRTRAARIASQERASA